MATWEAIKPAPPVISIFFGSYDIFFFLQTVKYTCVSSLFPRGKNVFACWVLDGLMMWIEFDKKFTCLFFAFFFETKNIKIKIIFPLHFTRPEVRKRRHLVFNFQRSYARPSFVESAGCD